MNAAAERKPRRFVTDPYETNNTALAASLILLGHEPVQVRPNRRQTGRVIWTFAPGVRPLAERWYETRDRLQRDIAWTSHEAQR